MNAVAMAVQVYHRRRISSRQSIINMTKLVDTGMRYGIPTLAVTAVGKDMARDARYFRLATRICAEIGAHYVKTYYVEDGFETVTASAARCRSSWPAARKSRRRDALDHGLPGPSSRAPPASTWAATSSRPRTPSP